MLIALLLTVGLAGPLSRKSCPGLYTPRVHTSGTQEDITVYISIVTIATDRTVAERSQASLVSGASQLVTPLQISQKSKSNN